MITFLSNLDPTVQSALVSAVTAGLILLAGKIFQFFYDGYSLSRKLDREYIFEQKKSIKVEISKTKTPLLQSTEDLNYRLWNLLSHLDEKWLNLEQHDWTRADHHYIRSFAYKWIALIYWILKAEKSVGSYDSTLSPKSDLLYLKYIKSIKFCLCDRLLIEGLGYTSTDTSNHFYIDDLPKFSDYIAKDGSTMSFHEFEAKLSIDHTPVQKVFVFLSAVKNDENNRSLNMLRVLHLLLIAFLNEFGHEYHRTTTDKIKSLIRDKKPKIAIASQFIAFLQRHKIDKDLADVTLILSHPEIESNSA